MATVDKKIADEIAAGMYAEDRPVKIVEYDNAWGGVSYGVIFEGEPLDRYSPSPYIMNPKTYWEKQ